MPIWILLIPVVLLGCGSISHSKRASVKGNIEIYFYPTSVVQDVRYSIVVVDDSLIFINHYRKSTKKIPDEFRCQLSNLQTQYINALIEGSFDAVYRNDIDVAAWGVKMVINERCVYQNEEFTSERTPEPYKSIIDYIVSILPFKLHFYSFS